MVRFVSFRFSPVRYLRFRFQVLTASRGHRPCHSDQERLNARRALGFPAAYRAAIRRGDTFVGDRSREIRWSGLVVRITRTCRDPSPKLVRRCGWDRFAVERSAVVVVGYPDDLEPCCPEHGKDLAHGNSVVFSDSPSVPETSIHLSVELQQVRPRKTSPDALSRNVLPTRFWSRMLGAPGR